MANSSNFIKDPGIQNGKVQTEFRDLDRTYKLRPYQDEMLQASLKQNSIVVLDTGAGKTHIAMSRIRAELESCDKDKLVWFLAPTVALCQQHNVSLHTDLPDYQIRVLTGEDEVDRWTDKLVWDAVLKNIRIVLSTYDVLSDALSHGFVTIGKLALIVFDEAHHCKRKHAGNIIMQDFYFPARRSGASVPHILGLTASPVVNAKTGGLELLESNLDSRSITPKLARNELMRHVHVPELVKHVYHSSAVEDLVTQSKLCAPLRRAIQGYNLDTDPYVLNLQSKNFDNATAQLNKAYTDKKTYCLDQLKGLDIRTNVILENIGPSALDWYLQACSQRMSKAVENTGTSWMPELSEQEKRHLARIMSDVLQCAPAAIEPTASLASKTQKLLEILNAQASPSFTGIIFVEQRAVAATLANIVSMHPLTAGLFSVGTLVGCSSSAKNKGNNLGDIVGLTGHQHDLHDFRLGKKNLIIATSVLEEGIDIPSCQTVICFDPPKNLVSFIQRRGRARKKGSKYIMLLGDDDAKAEPGKWLDLEEKMKAAYMDDVRKAREAAALEQRADDEGRQYRIPSTGALLTAQNAKPHLYHFCATLLSGSHTQLRPMFSVHEDDVTTLVTADVTLPAAVHASVRVASSSRPFRTERAAVADAAFEAYLALHNKGLVNDNLLPLHIKAPDPSGETSSQTSMVQTSPRVNPWSVCLKKGQHWTSSVVEIDIPDVVKTSLLMHLPTGLPPIPDITLYWNASTRGLVRITKTAECSLNQNDMVQQATDDTLNLFSLIYSESRVHRDKRDLVVLLQPIETRTSQAVVEASEVILGPGHKTQEEDYGLIRYRGQPGRAFLFQRLVGEPAGVDDTLIQVRKFPKNRNFLHKSGANLAQKDTCPINLPLSGCTMDCLPAQHAIAAACAPSILDCIENYLLAQEIQQTILQPTGITNLDLIIEATTSGSRHPEKNYERLEYLGDAVLKFCTHLQLTSQHPLWPESFLTLEKSRTNCNASLSKAALRTGIDAFVSTQTFSTHHWQPPYLSDVMNSAADKIERSTKTLADVVEALIGASYHDGGLSQALECIRIFLPDEEWLPHDIAHDMLISSTPNSQVPNAAILEELIGYEFGNRALLLEATTHSSCTSGETTFSYERLEFLGDAVLDQIIVPQLFGHQPPLKNHEMHRHRQSLANAHLLGFLCMEISIEKERNEVVKIPEAMKRTMKFDLAQSSHSFHLYDFLRCDQSVAGLRQAAVSKHAMLREQIHGALQHDSTYPWALLFELHPPKMFSDMIESLLGAIYIDSHGSLDACRAFLERCGLMKLMDRFLNEGVEVSFPKERLGKLADKEKVSYDTTKNASSESDERSFTSTVTIGGRVLATVDGCMFIDEAEVKVASLAISILEGERTNGNKTEIVVGIEEPGVW